MSAIGSEQPADGRRRRPQRLGRQQRGTEAERGTWLAVVSWQLGIERQQRRQLERLQQPEQPEQPERIERLEVRWPATGRSA